MANLSDKINAARQEGYTDDEIISHLSSTPDLRSKIDAAKQEGYSAKDIADFLGGASQQDAPTGEVSSLSDQFTSGLESNIEMPGQSLEIIGQSAGSDKIKNAGTALRNFTKAPKNFVSATDRFINPKEGDSYVDPVFGLGWGNAGGAAAEMAGNATGSLVARGVGTGVGAGAGFVAGGPVGAAVGGAGGAIAGPAFLGFISTVGPVALERAHNDGREEPSWEDWQAAAVTAGAVGALDAFGVGKIGILNAGLKEVGKTTTKSIAKEAVKDVGRNTAREAISGAGQSAVQQYGESAGTEKGATIDLKRVLGEGIAQGLGGGAVDAAIRGPRSAYKMGESVRVDADKAKYGDDANIRAEITRDVNAIAGRMKDGEQTTHELNRYVSDLRRQAAEAIDGQNIDAADKKALKGGLTDANGLTPKRLDEIAGRSDNPDEIKALVRKVQVVREMTVQQQAHKGWRGVASGLARVGGGMAGAAIAPLMGQSPIAGAGIGQGAGRYLARYLNGSQTQGHRLNKLVGDWKNRQAKALLDRYGPSKATEALNSLTERAAANKMQQEEEARATQQFNDTMATIRNWQAMRARSRAAEEKARTKEDKAKYQQERQKLDLAHREERLKSMAMQALIRATRHQELVQKLEQQKSMNALTVELAQVRNDLAKATAEAKKGQVDRQRQGEIDLLKGRMAKMELEIEARQHAARKAEISAKRAQVQLEKTQGTFQPTEAAMLAGVARRKYQKLTAKDLGDPKLDQYGATISDNVHYGEAKQHIQQMETEGLAAARELPDKQIGNILIKAIRSFQSYKGRKNQAKRMEVFHEVMREVPKDHVEAQRIVSEYIWPLASVFAGETNQTDGNRQDFRQPPKDEFDPDLEVPF